jgi:alginate O-acetyltransferase complex protein AlgI
VHWALRHQTARKLWLLLGSYVFYAAWDFRFLGLVAFSTLTNYAVALGLGSIGAPRRRRALIAASVVTNLALLGVFKYCGFFIDSVNALGRTLEFSIGLPTVSIVLPIGISFYTFQAISYTVDVYRDKLEPHRSLLDVALFLAFFPHMVAGPIVRARNLLPQLNRFRILSVIPVRSCLVLFLVGYFKKACVADNLAPVVEAYFEDPPGYGGSSALLATLLYSIQIYCDFSGYSDMAIGAAGLLGYHFGRNFAWPYFAPNIAEFWRRWHISLSSWLRDYVYIPLGGNRRGPARRSANLMLTMLVGGLWHGAAWRFVVWGGLHGLALTLQAWVARLRVPGVTRAMRLLGPVLTFSFVSLAWIFFRAEDMSTALTVLRACFVWQDGDKSIAPLWAIVVASLAVAHYLTMRWHRRRAWLRPPTPSFAFAYGLLFSAVVALEQAETSPFIYFQF